MGHLEMESSGRRLSGWKEIAAHLNQSVRNIQRWERFGLSEYRKSGMRGGQVSAFTDEVDKWERSKSVSLLDKVRELQATVRRLEKELRTLKSVKRR